MKPVHKPAVLAVLVLVFLAIPALADSQIRIVRLSTIEGSVQIERHAGQGSEKAILNMPITQDTVLSTGTDGRAETEFEDGTVVQLAPNSRIGFKQLVLRTSGDKASTVEVLQGIVYFNVRRKGHDEFSVAFAGREIPAMKSSRFRIIAAPEDVKLAVFQGELSFENRGEQFKVRKGEELTFSHAEDGTFLAMQISPGEYDAWAKQRTDYHDRYYSASAYKSYPYYGRGDLGFYGGWYDVPGIGPIWRPNNTGFGWDPFSNGYWSWYPGSGYMWVSGYPWGWLPYRYGSWTYVSGWGWGWAPYGNWNRWRQTPGIVNPPSGYRPPAPPAATPTSPGHHPIYVGDRPRDPREDRNWKYPDRVTRLPRQSEPDRLRPGQITVPPGSVARTPAGNTSAPGTSNAALPRQTPTVKLPPARPPQMHRGMVDRPQRDFEPMPGRGFSRGGRSDSGFTPSSPSAPRSTSGPSGGVSSGHSSVAPPPAPRSEPAPRSAPSGRMESSPRTVRNTN